jgi:hypothetical protein
MERGPFLGNLLPVERLGDLVETAPDRLPVRRVPLPPAPSELLINLGAPTATATLRFATATGLEGLADLRAPTYSPVEVLKI